MKRKDPKAYCEKCSSPIYSNVDRGAKGIICGSCTADLVDSIRHKENSLGVDFQNTADYKDRLIESTIGRTTLGELLKKARLQRGWSQSSLAGYLGVSQTVVTRMEHGTRRLPPKALEFVKSFINSGKSRQLVNDSLSVS